MGNTFYVEGDSGLEQYILVVENLVKRYGDKVALKGVSFRVEKGIVYSLLGPNGAGKTTLLSIIAGILNPTSGRVLVKGGDPRDPKARLHIGYCPQEHGLTELLTGRDNMMFYARLYGYSESEARKRVNELLDLVGLTDYADKPVAKYSGGMKKRLSLAITLLHDPDLLILDEPTTGMDPGMRRSVWDIILGLRKEGKTILLATHYMEEADYLSDRVAIMNEGEIVAEGSPEELKQKYGPKSVVELELYMPPKPSTIEDLGRFSDTIYLENNTIKVHTQDPDSIIPKLVDTLYSGGLSLKALRIAKPTLEDVFLKLTGRRLGE